MASNTARSLLSQNIIGIDFKDDIVVYTPMAAKATPICLTSPSEGFWKNKTKPKHPNSVENTRL